MEDTNDDKQKNMMKRLGIIPVGQETEDVETNSTTNTTSVQKKEDSVANGFNKALNFNKKTTKPTNPTPEKATTSDIVEEESILEEPEEVQTPNPPAKIKTPSIPKDESPFFSIKKEIDFNAIEFTLDFIPKHEGAGTAINYNTKEHEIETFNDLMYLLPKDTFAAPFKWIITIIFNDYEPLIREEAEWVTKKNSMTKEELINYVKNIETPEIRQIRLARLGLFTAPQKTRGPKCGRQITCYLGPEQMELLNLLMIALDTDEIPLAIRWIMNAFVDDYGDFIHEQAEEERYTNSLLYG
jgi:hypothetical protein